MQRSAVKCTSGEQEKPGSDPRLLINILGAKKMAKQTLITAVDRDYDDPSDCVELTIHTNAGKTFRIQIDTQTPFPGEWLNIEFRQPSEKHVTTFQIGCD
jgi:hypothetical protein